MLYLFRLVDDANRERGRSLPIADLSAVALERALLAANVAAAEKELAAALTADPALVTWAFRAAKHDELLLTTISDAATWLSANLVQHLRTSLRILPPAMDVERVAPQVAARYSSAYTVVLFKARATAHSDGLSNTIFHRADSSVYFSSMVSTAERLPEEASSLELREPCDPACYYFAADQPGIEWRLPALITKLSAYEEHLADFDRRLEHEKLESLKELAYGASHEINNPLANIAARAQTLLHGENDTDRRRKLTAIHRQAMRAHEMIADLMLFARPPKLEAAPCDLRPLVERIVDEVYDETAERQIEIAIHFAEDPVEVAADATQIAVAIKALVTNAIEAIGAGGHVDISVEQIAIDKQLLAQITVIDDGPGVSDAVRRHMFDPFFSGREAGRGLGFGLSKSWRIVTDHGGQIVVRKSTRRGAEISILLPLSPHPVPAAAEA